jgi:hypothetical protein
MEILFYKEKKFKQYLDLPIYSSECGIILRNLNNNLKVFKQTLISNGYLRITTHINGIQKAVSSHRLIATCWINNPENKPQVNHKNGIKTDNRVENLEWCTPSENGLHAFKTGLSTQPKGENHIYFGKRGGDTVRAKKVLDTSNGKIYDSLKDVVKDSVYSYKNLSRQLTGERKNKTTFVYIS